MSEESRQDHISQRIVVYRMPDAEAATVRRDVEYAATEAGGRTMDIYYPPAADSESAIPAIVIVAGYPDHGFEKAVGCKFKEMGAVVSWGRLIAASGMAAITYANRDPAADLEALLHYVRRNAVSLGIDGKRIGVWASSGNVPLALSRLMEETGDDLKCAVLCYGMMLDLGGTTSVAELAAQFGFSNPSAGKSVGDLASDIPLFIVRAGRDEFPHLNETIDRFLAEALICNLPITFVNHPTAPHAFDLLEDNEASRETIRQMLAFMRFHLLG